MKNTLLIFFQIVIKLAPIEKDMSRIFFRSDVMDLIKDYKLLKEKDGYTLIIYLNDFGSEFAKEFGHMSEERKEEARSNLIRYIDEKFPHLKINLCKVMIGSMLVGSVILSGGQVPTAKAAAVQSNNVNYTIKSGDSLWKISQRFGTTVNAIKSLNNLSSDTIYPNQVIKVPSENVITYQVKSGDSLYKIAKSYGTSIDKIKSYNNLKGDTIYTGQTLYITQGQGTPAPAPAPTPTPAPSTSTYTVQSGDNLWKIAKSYGISINQIKSLNNLSGDTIYPGQKLKVTGTYTESEPSVNYSNYTVKSGDTLWSISMDHGIPATELAEANGVSSESYFSIGQVIKIPVHHIPVKSTPGPQYGEYLDWWTEAQYLFKTNDTARVTDIETGKSFMVKRTTGANHADCEPLTSSDSAIAYDIWDGYSWTTRAITVEEDGRKIAASMSFMPHDVQYIENNNFDGHFDIHFLNSTRHKDGEIDPLHQEKVKDAAGY